MRPRIQSQRRQHICSRQMMLEGGALGRRQWAGGIPVQVPYEISFGITAHAIAQYKVVHPAANIDWINLNKPVVIESRLDAGYRLIEQHSPTVQPPSLQN